MGGWITWYNCTIYSKWYSTKKSVDLKSEYEKEIDIKYDMVMVTRFDIAWQTDIIFKDLNLNHFYAGIWNRRYTLDGKEIPFSPGEIVDISVGTKHRVENRGGRDLIFIETHLRGKIWLFY